MLIPAFRAVYYRSRCVPSKVERRGQGIVFEIQLKTKGSVNQKSPSGNREWRPAKTRRKDRSSSCPPISSCVKRSFKDVRGHF